MGVVACGLRECPLQVSVPVPARGRGRELQRAGDAFRFAKTTLVDSCGSPGGGQVPVAVEDALRVDAGAEASGPGRDRPESYNFV